MLSTTPLSSGYHRSYVRWDTCLERLASQAEGLANRGCADTCEIFAKRGLSDSGDSPALPLSLGEFRTACSEIDRSDNWLTNRDEVSCYTDGSGDVHLDVVNFGGFIVSGGHVQSRSVNAW